jgi:hypothetical protein
MHLAHAAAGRRKPAAMLSDPRYGQHPVPLEYSIGVVDLLCCQTVSIDTAYGVVTSLAAPLTFTNLTLPTSDRLVPCGADPASWPSETP